MSQADTAVRLPWDAFLKREVDKEHRLSEGQRSRALEGARAHIESFRRSDWPTIRRELDAAPHRYPIPDEDEPHWIAPGKAVYWQNYILREAVETTENGVARRVLQDVPKGWFPTDSGLPAGSAAMIAHYLAKGFRLRPPIAGVDVQTLESAVPSEALQVEPPLIVEPGRHFWCRRHGTKQFEFRTWKGYVRHCVKGREDLEENTPVDVELRRKQFPYYCAMHDVGFRTKSGAERHRTVERLRPGQPHHPSADEMEVK